jgi:hypothetical protein
MSLNVSAKLVLAIFFTSVLLAIAQANQVTTESITTNAAPKKQIAAVGEKVVTKEIVLEELTAISNQIVALNKQRDETLRRRDATTKKNNLQFQAKQITMQQFDQARSHQQQRICSRRND